MILEINDNNKKNNNLEEFSSELNNYIQKSETTFSIDRFEGDFAICENKQTGQMQSISKSDLPLNICEGDIIKFESGKYVLDVEATNKEKQEIKNLVDNLFKRKK